MPINYDGSPQHQSIGQNVPVDSNIQLINVLTRIQAVLDSESLRVRPLLDAIQGLKNSIEYNTSVQRELRDAMNVYNNNSTRKPQRVGYIHLLTEVDRQRLIEYLDSTLDNPTETLRNVVNGMKFIADWSIYD